MIAASVPVAVTQVKRRLFHQYKLDEVSNVARRKEVLALLACGMISSAAGDRMCACPCVDAGRDVL